MQHAVHHPPWCRMVQLDRCYDGEYVNGKRHGYGRYVYPNSFFAYEGNWEAGEKHGELMLQPCKPCCCTQLS